MKSRWHVKQRGDDAAVRCGAALFFAVWIGGSLSFILVSEIIDTCKHRQRMRELAAELAAIKLATRERPDYGKIEP
jgi:hypothetical protein